MERRYLSCAETAQLVRSALKKEFPAVKFSVRSSVYSGGASINVHWNDGPDTKAVEHIAKRYEGADFDGMIDMKSYASHWLMPDGSVVLAHADGTQGSMGVIPSYHADKPSPEAERVRFGADFIFCDRND